MFTDIRSKRVIFLAHCILNQNAISDGTAGYPAAHADVVRALLDAQVGIVQMPCPELCCLGLDRGDPRGAERPVVVENTRIRAALGTSEAAAKLDRLVDHVMLQIQEYRRHGFAIVGIVGSTAPPAAAWTPPPTTTGSCPVRASFWPGSPPPWTPPVSPFP